METIETLRLLLRPLRVEDASQIQVLFPQWDIVRYLACVVPWPYSLDGALHYCQNVAVPAMERGDAWHWTLRLKEKPTQVIGCISLMRGEENNLGFWLGLPWQKQGLMSEACEAVTDYWFGDLVSSACGYRRQP